MKTKLKLFSSLLLFCISILLLGTDVKASVAPPTGLKQTLEYTTASYFYVSWDINEDAYKYGLQYSTDKNNWSDENETIRMENYGYFDGLNAGTTYYVRVRSYSTKELDSYGEWSPIIAVDTKPANSSVIKHISSTQKSVTVSWTQTPGATGYHVYYGTSISDMVHFVSTSGTTATVTVPKNFCDYIIVRPFRNYANAANLLESEHYAYTTCPSVPTAPKNLRVTGRSNTYTNHRTHFSWDSSSVSENTDGYQLQIYYIKNGSAKRLKTLTTKGYNDTHKEYSNKKLYSYAFKYRVRSYIKINNKTYYSNWSSYKTYVPGARVKKLKNTSSSSKKILVWTKINGAKSYTVYWRNSLNSSWRRVAKNVKGSSATVKYDSSSSYNYYLVQANKVKVSKSKRSNTCSIAKRLDVSPFY